MKQDGANQLLIKRPERVKSLLRQWKDLTADELAEELALGVTTLEIKIKYEKTIEWLKRCAAPLNR